MSKFPLTRFLEHFGIILVTIIVPSISDSQDVAPKYSDDNSLGSCFVLKKPLAGEFAA